MNVFYGELAPFWPLISPVDDYASEAAYFGRLLAEHGAQTVLELGSGGGSNAAWLKDRFELTLVDLSPGMLEVSRALNPTCRHLQGDMRTVRLGETFDAVFIHDAIDSMTTEDDLAAAIATAAAHVRAGGVVILVPDHTTEAYEPDHSADGHDAPDGTSVRYLEWAMPVSDDGTVTTLYSFAIRHPDGRLQVAHDTLVSGLFPRDTWLRLVREAGLTARAVVEETDEDRPPRTLFVGIRGA